MRRADGLGKEPGRPAEQLSEVLTVGLEFAAGNGGVESSHEVSSFLIKAGPLQPRDIFLNGQVTAGHCFAGDLGIFHPCNSRRLLRD